MKDSILGQQWFNTDHLSKFNRLIQQAGYSLNGFKDTLLTPLLKKNGVWHIPADGFKSLRSPVTNHHYNSQKHLVTSLQFDDS